MNLNEERNYQMLLDTLDAMGLSGANRQLAEEYLEPGQVGRKACFKGRNFRISLLWIRNGRESAEAIWSIV